MLLTDSDLNQKSDPICRVVSHKDYIAAFYKGNVVERFTTNNLFVHSIFCSRKQHTCDRDTRFYIKGDIVTPACQRRR